MNLLVSSSLLTLIIFVTYSDVEGTTSKPHGECGDAPNWVPFVDSKCYKLVQTFATWGEAVDACQSESGSDGYPASMATIKSAEEQVFVSNYLFQTIGIVNNIWIGLHKPNENGSQFSWIDGTSVDEFQNWAEGSPSGEDGKDCVELESGSKTGQVSQGLWRDVNCARGNWVLCEKLQKWNDHEVQSIILQMRHQMEVQDGELTALKENPVPIGFIYVELPGQPQPSIIWPGVTWSDVSLSFAGNFFRVVGGSAGNFGVVQPASSGGIREFRQTNTVSEIAQSVSTTKEPAYASWRTARLETGASGYPQHFFIDFLVSEEEPRPINQAVRIWKRTQ